MRLDLTTLKLFLAAVEETSMAKAAEREHITAPAISKRIAELEEALDVRLLERHSAGIRPTAAGATLAADVRSVLGLLERAQSRLSEYAKGTRGRVRILANPSGLAAELPAQLQTYLLRYPQVEIDLEERRSVDVVRAVAEGEADIGIYAPHVPAEGLVVRPYRAVKLVAIVPHGHALAAKRTITLADAAEHDFVSLSEASAIGNLLNRMAAERGLSLQHRLRVTSFEALRCMVAAGLGLGVLPAHCAAPYAAAMRLRCIEIADSWAQYPLNICTRELDTLSMSARLLLAVLEQKSGESGF
jgi:DNA-binding transcriptional LysR family regulator